MKVLQAKTVLTAPWVCKELSAKGLELKASSTTCAACTMLRLIFTCGISWHDTPKFIRACIVAESQQRSRRLSYRVGISVCGDIKPRPISAYSNISSENLLSTHLTLDRLRPEKRPYQVRVFVQALGAQECAIEVSIAPTLKRVVSCKGGKDSYPLPVASFTSPGWVCLPYSSRLVGTR